MLETNTNAVTVLYSGGYIQVPFLFYLSLSDWAVLPGAPLNDAQKQEWQAYRQALRDIPQQSGFPEFVIVPDEPVKIVG